jgi:hypothetical protein
VEPVAEIIAALESRGITFWADGVGLRFAYEDAALQPGDSKLLGEVVLDREDEAVAFIRRRQRLDDFGKFAGMFRSAVYRIRTPRGVLVWVAERAPKLHRELTVALPDLVQRLWEDGAPIEEFERAVRALEEGHRVAMGFYLACQKEEAN